MVLPLLAAQAADMAYQTAMGGLTAAVNGLKDRFDKALQFADNAQKQSLALGRTYEEARKDLGNSIKGLRGSLENQFGVGVQLLRAGLDRNSAGVAKLINQQQLTGTSFNNTARAFAKLEAVLGISKEASNQLSENIQLLNYKFGISTDKLVDVLVSLKETLPIQKLLGLGSNFQNAIIQLQAEVGPALADELVASIKYFLEPSFERTAQLQMAGIGGLRDLLKTGGTTDEIVQQLKNAIGIASRVFERQVGGNAQNIRFVEQLFGTGILSVYSLFQGLGKRDPKDVAKERALSEFALSIETLKGEMFAPLDELISTKLYPAFKDLYEILSSSVNVFFRSYSTFIDSITKDQDGKPISLTLSEPFKELKKQLIDAAESIGKLGLKILTFVTEGGIDLLKDIFTLVIEGLEATFKPGGVFDGFRVALLSLPSKIIGAFNALPFIDLEKEKKEADILAFKERVRLDILRGVEVSTESKMGPMMRGQPAHILEETNYRLREATELGILDEFETIVKETKAARDLGLATKAGEIFDRMENNPAITAFMDAMSKMRANAEKQVSLLAGLYDEADKTARNTAKTADNTTPDSPLLSQFLQRSSDTVIDAINRFTIGDKEESLKVLEQIAINGTLTVESLEALRNTTTTPSNAVGTRN